MISKKKVLAKIQSFFSGRNQKFKVFSGQKQVISKKKRSPPTVEVFFLLHRFYRGIWCYIQPDLVGLFLFVNQRSIVDGGTLNLDRGTLSPPSPPYNLSTEYTTFESTTLGIPTCKTSPSFFQWKREHRRQLN